MRIILTTLFLVSGLMAVDVTFTVVDNSWSNTDVKYKGTATEWNVVQMYDNGTNGDEIAGDHVWTVIIENIPVGDHMWGAIDVANDDGTSCTLCDGSDGWGAWLISGNNPEYSISNGGDITGITSYTIDAYTASAEGTIVFTVDDRSQTNVAVEYKGTATNWETVPMYDDGTNGDAEAGDHVWTVTIENIPAGDHEWGAIEHDGSTWGIWLIEGPNLAYNLEDDLLTYHGQTNYIIPEPDDPPETFNVNITIQADMTILNSMGWDNSNHSMLVANDFGDFSLFESLEDPNIYEGSINADLIVGEEYWWKFLALSNDNDSFTNYGWETTPNRYIVIEDDQDIIFDPIVPQIAFLNVLESDVSVEIRSYWFEGVMNTNTGLPFEASPDTIWMDGLCLDEENVNYGFDCWQYNYNSLHPQTPYMVDENGDGEYVGFLNIPDGHYSAFSFRLITKDFFNNSNDLIPEHQVFGNKLFQIPHDNGIFQTIFGDLNPENPFYGDNSLIPDIQSEPQVSFDETQFQLIGPGDYGFLMVEDVTDTLPIFVTSSGASEIIISAYTDTLDLIANVLEEDGSYEIELVPAPNWYGYADLFVTISDEVGQDTAEVLVFVEPLDDPPVIVDIPDQETDEDTPLRVELEVYDVDGDYIDVHIREDMLYNTDGYIIANGDSILLVPHPDWHGTETVQVVAHSGIQEVFSSFTLTVNPVDDDPFVDGYLPDLYLYEDFEDTLREDLRGIFEDVDGELTFSVAFETEGVVSGVVVGDTMLTLTSLQDANGVTEMHITASNPTRASVIDTVLITVFAENDAPVVADMDPLVMTEDTPYEFMSMASLVEAGHITDVDNTLEELTFHLHSETDHVHVEWDGDANSTPMIHTEADYYGPGSLVLCAADEYEETCTTIGLNVDPVNDAPYFASEMHAPVGVALEFHLPLNPMDVDSEELVVTLNEAETNPAWVMLTDNMLHGTPDMLGEYPVHLSLTDGQATVVDTFNLHVVNFKPEIVAIEDIPNDQGGRVYIGFTPSFLDNGEHSGQGYDVYRHDMVDGESGWVMVASGNAIGEEHYVFEATTLSDSSSGYDWATEFKVVAAMENGIFHSDPVVGYSVDNIAPGIPGGLMAVAMDDNIHLSWNMSTEEDFQYFVLEKATNIDFAEPEVIQTADTAYTDVNFTANETNYYRLTAVDHAGNSSDYSEIVEAAVLSIDENMVPAVFALHQNYPNPFNPTTQIKYDIAEDSFVSITIFDVMGRNIRTLMNVNQNAGYHSIHWDAKNDMGEGVSAGMYIYVIQAGEFRATKKMVLLK